MEWEAFVACKDNSGRFVELHTKVGLGQLEEV
jgi:hypothetical protein